MQIQHDSCMADESQDTSQQEIIQCVFKFHTNHTLYARCMEEILYNIVYDFSQYNTLQYFYQNHKSKDSNVRDFASFLLFMQGFPDIILKFADMLSSSLPLSLNFIFETMEITKANFDTITLPSKPHHSLPNVIQLHEIIDPKHKNFCNIFPFVKLYRYTQDGKDLFDITDSIYNNQGGSHQDIKSTKLAYSNVNNETPIQENLRHLLTKFAHEILDSKTLVLQHNDCVFALSKNPLNLQSHLSSTRQLPYIIFADLHNAQSYLRLNDSQKSAIASFEKPFIKVSSKDAFAKLFDSYVVFASLPRDYIIALLFIVLRELDESLDYLFYTQFQDYEDVDLKIALKYEDRLPIQKNILQESFITSNAIMLNCFMQASSLAEILQINPAGDSRLIVYLSSRNESKFFIENLKEDSRFQQILNIDFPLNLAHHLKTLYTYKNGAKLIQNFVKANTDLLKVWNLSQKTIEELALQDFCETPTNNALMQQETKVIYTRNLLDIFQLIQELLQLPCGVLEMANRCVRDRGPRIDYKLKRHDDNIILDYARLLRSVMSFQLAGVEYELLCYGVIDSLAEFIGTLASDMLINYGIKEVFVCGDLLLEQCFLDKIINAIPKNMIFNLPKDGSIDIQL